MELGAEQFLWLKPAGEAGAPAGAVSAAVEYRTAHGRGYFPVAAALAEPLLQSPELAGLTGPLTLKFLQTDTGAWQAVFTASGAAAPLVWEVRGDLIAGLLAQSGFPAALLEQLRAAAAPGTQDAPPWAE